MDSQITHLTYTGYNAGTTLCDSPRNNIDRYVHAVYSHQLDRKKFTICKKCQKIWDICSVCDIDDDCDTCKKLK